MRFALAVIALTISSAAWAQDYRQKPPPSPGCVARCLGGGGDPQALDACLFRLQGISMRAGPQCGDAQFQCVLECVRMQEEGGLPRRMRERGGDVPRGR